jgi:hypothetical protein
VQVVNTTSLFGKTTPLKSQILRVSVSSNLNSNQRESSEKNCLINNACEICGTATDNAAHLIAGCAFSFGFWSHIGIDLTEDDVVNLWVVRPRVHLPTTHFNVFLLLCCWRLWKHRHDVTFRSLPHATIGYLRGVVRTLIFGRVDCPMPIGMYPLHGVKCSHPSPLLKCSVHVQLS